VILPLYVQMMAADQQRVVDALAGSLVRRDGVRSRVAGSG
jgi:hypothetical protein